MFEISARTAASRALKCIIAMDICTIGIIKDVRSVSNGTNENKKKRRQDLISMARTGRYQFSFVMAIVEKATDLEHPMTLKEMIARFQKDYQSLSAYLSPGNMCESQSQLKSLIKIIMDENFSIKERAELNIEQYLDFLVFYNGLGIKKDPEPASERLILAKKITDYGEELGISRGHPVIAICVASIYGCEGARRILKVEGKGGFNASNALGDIMSFYRIAKARHMLIKNVPGIRIEFRTEDRGLESMHEFYSATVVDAIDDTSLLSVFDLNDKKMFPRLTSKANGINKKERDALYEMLDFRKPQKASA